MSRAGPWHPKRQRIGQACDQCRKRKSKCGGEIPACVVCLSLNRLCSYDSGSRRRGLQTGYVRGLETLLGTFILESPKGEQKVRTRLRSAEVAGDILEHGSTSGLLDTWRRSNLCKDLEQLLSSSDDTEGASVDILSPIEPPDTSDGHADDPRSPSSLGERREQVNNQPSSVSGDVGSGHVPVETRDFVDRGQLPAETQAFVNSGRLPAETQDFVDFYFLHTHPWFPILERRDILRTTHSETPMRDLESKEKGYRACIWAIIALSLAQQKQRPKGIPTSQNIQEWVQSHIARSDQELELGHVQAILIIALLRMAWGHFEAAWTLVGNATRMLLLYKKYPPRYDHTFRGCLMLDVILSALLGNKPYYPSSEISNPRPLDEDSLDEWEMWTPPPNQLEDHMTPKRRPLRALSSFNLGFQLVQRLTMALWQPADEVSLRNIIEELQSWKANLPKHTERQNFDPLNPPQLNLHLMWNFVMSTISMQARTVDESFAKMAEQSTYSTLDILQKYLPYTGATSPLLVAFGQQAQRCLQALCRSQSTTTISSSIIQFDEVHESLKRQWQVDGHLMEQEVHGGGQTAATENIHSVSAPLSRSFYTPSHGEHSRQAPFNTANGPAPFLQLPSHHLMQSQSIPETGFDPGPPVAIEQSQDLEGSASYAEDQFSEINDFDMMFGDASTIMAMERPNQQLEFALNLGFMTNDLDPDFSAFLHGRTQETAENLEEQMSTS